MPRRRNPVLPEFYGVLSQQDLLYLNRLEAEWQTFRMLAERAYEQADHMRAVDYDARADELAQRLEDASSEVLDDGLADEDVGVVVNGDWARTPMYARGGEGEPIAEDEPGVEEQFAQLYADWIQSPAASVSYQRWDDEAQFVQTLRWIVQHRPGFLGATDDQLLDAARDAYEVWRWRVDRARARTRDNPFSYPEEIESRPLILRNGPRRNISASWAPTQRIVFSPSAWDKYPLDPPLQSPRLVAEFVQSVIGDTAVEVALAVLLDARNRVIGVVEIGKGSTSYAPVDPAVLLRAMLLANAAGVIFAHNHPSGEEMPSTSDRALFQQLKAAVQLTQMSVVDFVIVTPQGKFWSALQQGVL